MIAEAREAQALWASIPLRGRCQSIRAAAGVIHDRADQIAELVARCTGKTRIDALSTEVIPSALAARTYSRLAPKALKQHRLRGGSLLFFNKRSLLTRAPYGVIGIISPWNYPFDIPLQSVFQALLAGNGVVLKVATQVQPVGELIAGLLEAIRLPRGLFQLLHLPGPSAGTALIEGGVDKLLFTGSTAVARELMAKAAGRLLPLCLELGGNDAMIVLRDANLQRAAAGAAWAGISNCGQSCAGVERIYVERPAYAEFVKLLRERVETLRQGSDREGDADADFGSLTLERQLRRVRAHLEDALAKGAVITARSRENKASELFHPALVLENVREDMLPLKEEVFGPLLAVAPVDGWEEAVRKANDSAYGLSASIWTKDQKLALRIACQLEVGSVTVNDHLMSHGLAETPWGGFKQSGIGRLHGLLGFEELTRPRVVVFERLHRLPRNMWWYPHHRGVYRGLKAMLSLLYGRSLGERLKGLIEVAGLFLRSFHSKGA